MTEHRTEHNDEEVEDDASEESTTMTEGPYVKVRDEKAENETLPEDSATDEPDVYDINVVSWDCPTSPLHLAILGGHVSVIETLVESFGAGVLLPVKLVITYSRNPRAAIMTLVLAANQRSGEVGEKLLSLGASSQQGDMGGVSALHYILAKHNIELLRACFDHDRPAAAGALHHALVSNLSWRGIANVESMLTTATKLKDQRLVEFLLDAGAPPEIFLNDFAASYNFVTESQGASFYHSNLKDSYRQSVLQPILLAVDNDLPDVVNKLMDLGADINTIDTEAQQCLVESESKDTEQILKGKSLLDKVREKVTHLNEQARLEIDIPEPIMPEDDQHYLSD